MQIVQLLVSPLHRYVGRPADGPQPTDGDELVDSVVVRAGLGIVGDRYFNQRAHRHAAVTLMAAESLPAHIRADVDLRQLRRNVLLSGVAVDELCGSTVELTAGADPVRFAVRRPARPCSWLDVTVGPGARKALLRTGGVRCAPLSDGVLRVGPAMLTVLS